MIVEKMVFLMLLLHHAKLKKGNRGKKKAIWQPSSYLVRMILVRGELKIQIGLNSHYGTAATPAIRSLEMAQQHIKFWEHQHDAVFNFENING